MKSYHCILLFLAVLTGIAFTSCDPDVSDGNNTVPEIVMALYEKSPSEADEYLQKKGFAQTNSIIFPTNIREQAVLYFRPAKMVDLPDSAFREALKNNPYERIDVYYNDNEPTPYYITGKQECSSSEQAYQKYKSWINVMENRNKKPDFWFGSFSRIEWILPFYEDWVTHEYLDGPIGKECLNNPDSLYNNYSGTRDDFRRELFWQNQKKLRESKVYLVYTDDRKTGKKIQTRYHGYSSDDYSEKFVTFRIFRGNISQSLPLAAPPSTE